MANDWAKTRGAILADARRNVSRNREAAPQVFLSANVEKSRERAARNEIVGARSGSRRAYLRLGQTLSGSLVQSYSRANSAGVNVRD